MVKGELAEGTVLIVAGCSGGRVGCSWWGGELGRAVHPSPRGPVGTRGQPTLAFDIPALPYYSQPSAPPPPVLTRMWDILTPSALLTAISGRYWWVASHLPSIGVVRGDATVFRDPKIELTPPK